MYKVLSDYNFDHPMRKVQYLNWSAFPYHESLLLQIKVRHKHRFMPQFAILYHRMHMRKEHREAGGEVTQEAYG